MTVDLAASLIVWLRTQLLDVEIVGRVPRDRPTKLVLVRRIGGTWDWPMMDQPTISVEAWAPTLAQAHDLCQDVRSLVWSLQGGVLNDVPVYRIDEFAGPASLPDPETDTPRFVATFSIRHREHLEAPA